MTKKDDFELQDFLPYLLNQAAERNSLAFQRVYKSRYGMLRTEWRVLFHLGIYGKLTAGEISHRAKVHKTKISRAVHKLHTRRFLTRHPIESDRRSESLELTPAGRAAYQDLRAVAQAHDHQVLAEFAPEDIERLKSMLRKLAGPNTRKRT